MNWLHNNTSVVRGPIRDFKYSKEKQPTFHPGRPGRIIKYNVSKVGAFSFRDFFFILKELENSSSEIKTEFKGW